MNYTAPTLVTRLNSPLSFQQLLEAWFSIRGELPDAITLLCGPFYAPFIYSEHRFGSTFQSAEALARARFGGAEKARAAHAARMDRVIAAARDAGMEADEMEWAARVLRSHNDKTLADLMKELVESTGAIGSAILAKVPDFHKEAASARTRVSHPGANRGRALSTEQRYWHGEALLWVVRASLLAELGVDSCEISRRVQSRGGFLETLQHLGD
jgi:hypothetical protein